MAQLADIILPAGAKKIAIAIAPQIFDTSEARGRAAMIIAACDVADRQIEVATALPGKQS